MESVRSGHHPADGPGTDIRMALLFTLSLDDVVVASFTSGPVASTLPMVVFSSMRTGPTLELYALATVIVVVVARIMTAVNYTSLAKHER
jgi:putrescine transport system permease protein